MKEASACAGSWVDEVEDDESEDEEVLLVDELELLPMPIWDRAWVIALSIPPPLGGGGPMPMSLLLPVRLVFLVLLSWLSWEIQLLSFDTLLIVILHLLEKVKNHRATCT